MKTPFQHNFHNFERDTRSPISIETKAAKKKENNLKINTS